MLAIADIEALAFSRLREAAALFLAKEYDGTAYISGYAVELILKAQICKHLKWTGYPATNKEFERFQSFRIHDLETLLSLTEIQEKVRTDHIEHWSNVRGWAPGDRYRPAGSITQAQARRHLASASFFVSRL
jgi:hypothetical protein